MIADRDLLYFKFVNEEDRKMVIEHGPLFIASRIFVVRPWSESIEQHQNKMKSLPIWVKLDLPKQLWTGNGIDFVLSIIGEPICMDNATANRTRLSYARICAVVNTNFKFPSSIRVNLDDGKEADISLEYDWIPSLCKICNIFGHTDAKCHKNKKAQTTQNPKHHEITNVASPTSQVTEVDVGSLMVIIPTQVNVTANTNVDAARALATKVVLGTHRDVAPAKDTHQDVAFAHMNAEIRNVDLNVGVQVDIVPVLLDVAIVANASHNVMIGEQACAPMMKQQTRYKTNLDGNSKQYRDPTLTQLFTKWLGDIYEKAKDLLGDDWVQIQYIRGLHSSMQISIRGGLGEREKKGDPALDLLSSLDLAQETRASSLMFKKAFLESKFCSDIRFFRKLGTRIFILAGR
ncbi:hypothetical protein IFM89_022184 [Coptis chinensis]|uniref:DUF4283 domain-containing protein n=1 Tax=Coptis chinensis TaxID=261450 RepID=A0A835GYJ4_9MAGN|nr:hypothetical protein IFM89_022184 [Coptis chinensis]